MELKPFWLRLRQLYHTWRSNLLYSWRICYHCGWHRCMSKSGGVCQNCWSLYIPEDIR